MERDADQCEHQDKLIQSLKPSIMSKRVIDPPLHSDGVMHRLAQTCRTHSTVKLELGNMQRPVRTFQLMIAVWLGFGNDCCIII